MSISGTADRHARGGDVNDRSTVANVGDVVIERLGSSIDLARSSNGHDLGNKVEKSPPTGTLSMDGSGNARANTITGNAGNNAVDGGTARTRCSAGQERTSSTSRAR